MNNVDYFVHLLTATPTPFTQALKLCGSPVDTVNLLNSLSDDQIYQIMEKNVDVYWIISSYSIMGNHSRFILNKKRMQEFITNHIEYAQMLFMTEYLDIFPEWIVDWMVNDPDMVSLKLLYI